MYSVNRLDRECDSAGRKRRAMNKGREEREREEKGKKRRDVKEKNLGLRAGCQR